MEETIRDEITRKDGVTYKRKPKDKKYDCYLSVKVKSEMRDKLKRILIYRLCIKRIHHYFICH